MSGDKVPLRNEEGYLDLTAHDAMVNVMNEKRMDEADYRHWRLIKTLLNLIDLMGYDLLSRIEVRDRKSGRTYK
jgi:hypothetical protein